MAATETKGSRAVRRTLPGMLTQRDRGLGGDMKQKERRRFQSCRLVSAVLLVARSSAGRTGEEWVSCSVGCVGVQLLARKYVYLRMCILMQICAYVLFLCMRACVCVRVIYACKWVCMF